jgi:hypothetical protein
MIGVLLLISFIRVAFSEFSQRRFTGASGHEGTLAASHIIQGVDQMQFAYRTTSAVALAAVLGGCATSQLSPRDSNNRTSPSDLLTENDIARIVVPGSSLKVLQQLRPAWLLPRGATTPGVSVDGGPNTDLSVLELIQASTVAEVRLERASSHSGGSRVTPNGSVIVGDMIIVTTRRGGRAEP